jgi:tRNA(fMet)-specific endonuclease VapC
VDLILDTNALSAVAEGWPEITRTIGAAAQVAIPVIALGEYRFGIARSRYRVEYERWLKKYLPAYTVLGVDDETAVAYAQLRLELKAAGTPIPSNDIWIAALCRQHSQPILSRDLHFDLVRGLQRLAW